MQQAPGRGILRSYQDWDQQMMSDLEYAKNLCQPAKILIPKAGSSFERLKFHGKYAVKCEAVQYDWPGLSKQSRLRVVRSRRPAIFDLGIIIGLMVLGKKQEHVMRLLQNGKADPVDVTEIDDESESEDASSDEEDGDDERASACGEDPDYNKCDEPHTPINLTPNRPAKRQKIESSHPRRLYFQWRGYNTMSGAIQFDPSNRNTGYLDFANDEATVFKGNIRMDAIGGGISFQGYKVPGMGGPLTMNWNALSHLASERAKVPEHVW